MSLTSLNSHDRFFRNKGAVAGVFLIVGLAAASIVLFLFFFIRRRRRQARFEHDAAVASTLAAAGFNRTPVDGDDDDDVGMRHRQNSFGTRTFGSIPSASHPGSMGSAGGAIERYRDDPFAATLPPNEFDPYAGFGGIAVPAAAVAGGSGRRDGYMPARTTTPPPGGAAAQSHSHNPSYSSSSGGHVARESAGSFEPLLAGYNKSAGATPPLTPAPAAAAAGGNGQLTPVVPPRNPARSNESRPPSNSGEGSGSGRKTSVSSVYSGEDDDLVPDLTPQTKLEVSTLMMFLSLCSPFWLVLRFGTCNQETSPETPPSCGGETKTRGLFDLIR